MSTEEENQFCLKWNNFQHNITSQFETLKEDEDFVDVTLSCHGQSLKAHKLVLSACSPYLKNLFKENPCKHPVIILENLTFTDLEALVAFIYTGQVYVAQAELNSFLKAAEALQIRGLSDSPDSPTIIQGDDSPPTPSNTESPPINMSAPPFKKPRHAQSVSDEEGEQYKTPPRSPKKPPRRASANFTFDLDQQEVPPPKQEPEYSGEMDMMPRMSSSTSRECLTVEGRPVGEQRGNFTANVTANVEMENFTSEGRKPHSLDPRPCPLCNRVYSNLSNLRQHMRLIHNPTLVTCKLCSKTFKTDLYLRRHLTSFHEPNFNSLVNSFVSIEPVGAGTPTWQKPLKVEPPAFKEMFDTSDGYQVPH